MVTAGIPSRSASAPVSSRLKASAREVVSRSTGLGGSRTTDFGLVVGVDHYPRFSSLQGAVSDAARFHAWLCDADGGGLALEHSRLVLSRPNPLSPLQDEVDEQLLEIVTA